MPRGRQPEGDTVLSNAERQARHRARQKTIQPPAVIKRPKADRRSRVQRWDDASAAMLTIQVECAAWFDALPESLRDSATAAALQEIIDLDLDVIAAIRPPRGYGRD
jgi:hypothetical protein